MFDATTGNLLFTFDDPTPTVFDSFGVDVAMDGNHVLVGDYGDDTLGQNVGQAHLFDATTGNLLRTFYNPNPTSGKIFGRSVAIHGDRILIGGKVGNIGPVQAYLFDTTGNLLHTFNPDPTRINDASFDVALDGNQVLISRGSGVDPQVHLIDALGGDLLQTFGDSSQGGFGASVALNGGRVLIGASENDTNGQNVGQAYLFTQIRADLNGDGLIDCVDVDSLVAEIVAGTHGSGLDLTADGLVNNDDLDEWLVQGGAANLPSGNPYLPGDANLDGVVDGSDFNVWNANKFSGTAAWCSGDFNADGSIDGSDFNIWNSNKFTSANAVSAVPEPVCPVVCHVVSLLFAVSWGRRRLGVS